MAARKIVASPNTPGPPASERALEGRLVLPGAQRDVDSLAPQLKALKQVSHALPQPIMAETSELDLVDQLPAEHRRLVAQPGTHFARWILVLLKAGLQQLKELDRQTARRDDGIARAA